MVTRYYHKGDKVFAKMRGYHAWPARIDAIVKVSNTPAKALYKVFFYGTHQTAVCKPQILLDFEENKDKLGHHGKSFSFYDAMVEIDEDPDVTHDPSAEPMQKTESEKLNKKKLVTKRTHSSSQNGAKTKKIEHKKKKKESLKKKSNDGTDEDGKIRVILTRTQLDNLLALEDTPQSLKDKLTTLISS